MSLCHLCGESLDDAAIVGTMSRHGKPSRRVCCSGCSLVAVNPQPDRAALEAYYQGDYHRDQPTASLSFGRAGEVLFTVSPDDPRYPEAVAEMHRTRAHRVIEDLGLPEGSRILEVGCSDGHTLLELQRRGMDVQGIEPDPVKAEQAADRLRDGPRGDAFFRIFNGSLETVEPRKRDDVFDAVIAFHVLEHFPDPLDALAKIRTLLKPGGQVWFEVPNVLMPNVPLTDHWQWVHLYDFSETTLHALLWRAGFHDIVADGSTWQLTGRASYSGSGPREYEHEPHSIDVPAFLRSIENGEPIPVQNTRGRALQAVRDGHAPELGALQADLAGYDESVAHMGKAYDEAITLISDMAGVLNDEAVVKLESWTPKVEAQAFTMGEAHQLWRVRSMLGHVAYTMTARKLGGGR